MKLVDWLFRAAPSDDEPAPEIVKAPPELPPEDDAESTAPEMMADADGSIALDDVFAAIEYRDSLGRLSRRRITMLRLKPGRTGILLHAICHERRAFRCFRADQIGCFIDLDGEIIEPADFWRSIGIDLDAIAPGSAVPRDQQLRDTFRPALSILVTLSRCDGFMHPAEITAILSYIADEAFDLGIPCDDAALNELQKLVERMRPRRASIKGHFVNVLNSGDRTQRRLVRAIREVILADGHIAAEEADFAHTLERWAAEQLNSDSPDLADQVVYKLFEERLVRVERSGR